MQLKHFALASMALTTARAQDAGASVGIGLSAGAYIQSLDNIAGLSDRSTSTVQQANQANLIGVIPKVLANLKDIITASVESIQQLSAATALTLSEGEQVKLAAAFDAFVAAQIRLSDSLVGQSSILGGTAFGASIGAVLRVLLGIFDAYAERIIALVPTVRDKVIADKAALDAAIRKALILYPVILPSFTFGGGVTATIGGSAGGQTVTPPQPPLLGGLFG